MLDFNYRITDRMVSLLLRIERANVYVMFTPITAAYTEELRMSAWEETNNLSELIDEYPLQNRTYIQSFLDNADQRSLPITEEFIRRLHTVIHGTVDLRMRNVEYRDDGPFWESIPRLMEDLVAALISPASNDVPIPIKAGLWMKHFWTISPFSFGNLRTVRFLITHCLRCGGYGLKQFLVIERCFTSEFIRDFDSSVFTAQKNNDDTAWLEHILQILATEYEQVAATVKTLFERLTISFPEPLRQLDEEQRRVFIQLALKREYLSTVELRDLLRLSERSIRDRINTWRDLQFIEPTDKDAQRIRSIKLTTRYEKLAHEIRSNTDRYPIGHLLFQEKGIL